MGTETLPVDVDAAFNASLLNDLERRQLIRRAQSGDILPLVRYLWPSVTFDTWQEDILRSTFDPLMREVFVKGNTGCGKNASFAWVACCYYLIWPDAKIVVTRDSYSTAVGVAFNEIARWWRMMSWKPPGVVLQTAAIIDENNRSHVLTVASPGTGEGFSGTHAEHVLFIFDEATAPVLEERYKLVPTQATKFLAVANPRTMAGHFRQAFDVAADPNQTQTVLGPHGYRRLITVSGMDCMNVREKRLKHPVAPQGGIEIDGRQYMHGEPLTPEAYELVRPIIPGQTCWDEYQGLLANPDKRWVAIFAHGKFPDEDPETQVIQRAWIVPQHRWHAKLQDVRQRRCGDGVTGRGYRRLRQAWPIEAAGLDVGGSSAGDPSVLTIGGRRGVWAQHVAQISKAEDLVQWVVSTLRGVYDINTAHEPFAICVDTDGIGWGVCGLLRKAGCQVLEFRGNETSKADPKRYGNMRAESYGELAKRLSPADGPVEPFSIPDDPMLLAELLAPQKVYGQDGLKWNITPKRPVPGQDKGKPTIQSMLGRSPDRADSLVYFYHAIRYRGLSTMDAAAMVF